MNESEDLLVLAPAHKEDNKVKKEEREREKGGGEREREREKGGGERERRRRERKEEALLEGSSSCVPLLLVGRIFKGALKIFP